MKVYLVGFVCLVIGTILGNVAGISGYVLINQNTIKQAPTLTEMQDCKDYYDNNIDLIHERFWPTEGRKQVIYSVVTNSCLAANFYNSYPDNQNVPQYEVRNSALIIDLNAEKILASYNSESGGSLADINNCTYTWNNLKYENPDGKFLDETRCDNGTEFHDKWIQISREYGFTAWD